jgi:hypothetical protein
MEAAHLLGSSLEESFGRETGNALALRAILLSRQWLGERIHDTRRLHGFDPTKD